MIITVNSFDEAKNYPVMFGQSELLMDNTKDLFYVKSVDNLGKITMGTYRFEKIDYNPTDTVSMEQFNALNAKLDAILKSMGGMNNEQPIIRNEQKRTTGKQSNGNGTTD